MAETNLIEELENLNSEYEMLMNIGGCDNEQKCNDVLSQITEIENLLIK